MTTIYETQSFTGVATIAQLAGVAGNSTTTEMRDNDTPSNHFALDAGGLAGQRLKSIASIVGRRYIGQLLPAAHTTLVMGCKYTPVATSENGLVIMSLGRDENNPSDFQLMFDSAAPTVQVKQGGSTVLDMPGVTLVAGTRHVFEMKAFLVTGTTWGVEVRLNGTVIGTTSSIAAGFSTGLKFWCCGSAQSSGAKLQSGDFWEEAYIADGYVAGAGTWRLQVMRANGAGAHTDWIPDSGANYARVNEQNVSDASYVEATFDNDEDAYEYADPTHIASHSVRAVNVKSRAAYLSGAKNLAHVIRDSGGTEGQGADKALASALSYVGTVFNKQADGTTDWGSFNDLDSYQFGRKQRA